MRNPVTISAIALAATIASAGMGMAGEMRTGKVRTHPSQGEVTVVADATSRLHADPGGIHVSMDTAGLTPGHVHTLWLVTINNPGACEDIPCSSKDVLKRTAMVDADVGYAGGIIAGADGEGRFSAYQPVGDLTGGWFGAGLEATPGIEVHLVVNDHGPVIEPRIHDMLTSYRGGCTDESIPAPMPESARAQGKPGPNACRLVQFSIFKPDTNPS